MRWRPASLTGQMIWQRMFATKLFPWNCDKVFPLLSSTVSNSVYSAFITTIIIGSRLQAWMTIRGWGLWWQKTGFHSAGWQRWQRWQHLWLWSEVSWCRIRKSSSSISRRHYHCLSTTTVIIWVQHHTASCLWFEKIGTNVQTIWRRSQVLQSKAANDFKQTKKVPF